MLLVLLHVKAAGHVDARSIQSIPTSSTSKIKVALEGILMVVCGQGKQLTSGSSLGGAGFLSHSAKIPWLKTWC